jgi:hypothetical protein
MDTLERRLSFGQRKHSLVSQVHNPNESDPPELDKRSQFGHRQVRQLGAAYSGTDQHNNGGAGRRTHTLGPRIAGACMSVPTVSLRGL